MKKYLGILPFTVFFFGQTIAQNISGNVRDLQGHPLEFATIVLQRANDTSFVAGSLTDTSGFYFFENMVAGQYRLLATQIGYLKNNTPPFELRPEEVTFRQDFILKEDALVLGEVEIRAQKPVVVQEPGKLIVNVENTASSVGLMALDVLRKMPGVQVDNDGNISLKGKSQVQIMLDGKPSYLSAKQMATILKSLPSNQIANIEIITSPSAKYDAAGNAGIININMKKSDKKGTNGTFQTTLGHGRLPKSNTGLSLTLGLKKWQINALYDYALKQDFNEFIQERSIGKKSEGERYAQSQYYFTPLQSHTYRLGVDYTVSSKLHLNLQHRGMYMEDRWIGDNTGTLSNRNGITQQIIHSQDNNPNYNSDLGLGLGGKYRFDSAAHELSVDGEISRYTQRSRQNAFTSIGETGKTSTMDFKANLPLTNIIAWGKVDYTKTVFKNLKLETGYKHTNTNIDNLVEYEVAQTGQFLAEIPDNNRFTYHEEINAAYISTRWDSTHWGLQLGLRAEHWQAQGSLKNASFTRDSLQFFPNFQAKYKFNPKHEISVAGSRRIDRPNYLMLNPIAYYSDPYTYYVGNPRVQPQSTYHFELAHNYLAGLLSTTLHYSQTRNVMLDYNMSQASDTGKIQYIGAVNVPLLHNYGLSSSLYMTIGRIWTCQVFASVYRSQYEGNTAGQNATNGLWCYSLNGTQLFLLPQNWSVELSGNYNSPSIYGYTTIKQMGMLSLAIKKELWAGRLVAKLNFQDIFYTFQYRGVTDNERMSSTHTYRWDNRVVNLSLVWKIGKGTDSK
jgi:hypothetical protein